MGTKYPGHVFLGGTGINILFCPLLKTISISEFCCNKWNSCRPSGDHLLNISYIVHTIETEPKNPWSLWYALIEKKLPLRSIFPTIWENSSITLIALLTYALIKLIWTVLSYLLNCKQLEDRPSIGFISVYLTAPCRSCYTKQAFIKY